MTDTKIHVLSKEWWELHKKTQREKNAYYAALIEKLALNTKESK